MNIAELHADFQRFVLCDILALALFAFPLAALVQVCRKLTKSGGLFLLVGAVWFAFVAFPLHSDKNEPLQQVIFPATDSSAVYLFDNGSYVTNDAVHLAFTTLILPSSADIHLDYRVKGSTNDEDFATAFNVPLGTLTLPMDYPWPAATNFEWWCYTTWTPGAQTVTNDIFIINWILDRARAEDLVPIRTALELDGAPLIDLNHQEGETP